MDLPKVVGPNDGKSGFLGSIGARFMIFGVRKPANRFSLVEHPMSAHALAAPLHKHGREDEYSYVLEGSIGALLGDSVASLASRAISSSNRATNGTRFGTQATRRLGS